MPPADSNLILSAHLTRLLKTSPGSRMDVARRMGVADGTLGRIKYGRANPTIDVVDKIARFYRVPAWTLLRPEGEGDPDQPGLSPEARHIAELFAALPPEKQQAIRALLEP